MSAESKERRGNVVDNSMAFVVIILVFCMAALAICGTISECIAIFK